MELKELSNIIQEISGIDSTTIDVNTHLVDELEFDELDKAELSCEIENTTGKEVFSEDMEEWITVGDILDFIKA